MKHNFNVTRKIIAAATSEDCECKVTAVAVQGKPVKLFHVHRCGPEHAKFVRRLEAAAEAAAENKNES